MTRAPFLLLATLAALATAAAVAAPGGAATAPSIVDCGSTEAARWRDGSRSGTTWLLVSSSNQTCAQARAFVPRLAAVTGSSGVVDQVKLRLTDPVPATCTVRRSLLIGICLAPVAGSTTPRTVILLAGTPTNAALRTGFLGSGAVLSATVQAVLGDSGSGSAPSVPSGENAGRSPVDCTPTAGARWRVAGSTGDRWHAFGGGGLPCLAAKGWVADVSRWLGQLDGGQPAVRPADDGWTCVVGTEGVRLGVCARARKASEEGGDLEPRSAVIVPLGAPSSVVSRIRAYGLDAAARELGRPFADPGTFAGCGQLKAARQRGGASDKWQIGTSGGYPCSAARTFGALLSGWSSVDRTRLTGVLEKWRCVSRAEPQTTVCTWTGPGGDPGRAPLRIAIVPLLPGAEAALASLLTGE